MWKLVASGLLVLVLAAAVGGCSSTAAGDGGGDTTESAPPVTSGEDTVGESSEPDTGRMSQTEYDLFVGLHEEVVDESLQWSEGLQPCAVIGQSGDLAGFRECVQEAWDGTEGALLAAGSNADDTLDDVAKKCRKSLKSYFDAVTAYYAANMSAYDTANALDFEAMTTAFKQLPKVAKRYPKASLDTLAKCEPR